MDKNLVMIQCDPDCGFVIKSHNKEEVKEAAKKHAKNIHNKEVSDEEVELMIKPA